MKPQPRNGHIEKWPFLVQRYTIFLRLKASMQAKQGFFVLKLIPFIDMQDEYFKFIVDLMEIVSLISFGLDSL